MTADPATIQADTEAALRGSSVCAGRPVHANLSAAQLVEHAVRRGEGQLSDRRRVDRAHRRAYRPVGAGQVCRRRARDHRRCLVGNDQPAGFRRRSSARCRRRVQAYLQGQDLFTQDLYAGADPAHRVRVRLVTTGAWQALFARNMFIRPPAGELAGFTPDYVILHAPDFQADPAIDGVRSPTAIALSFAQKMIVIAGTRICRRDQEVDLHGHELAAAGRRACCRCIAAPISAPTAMWRCSSACPAPARPRCRRIRSAG